MPQSHISKNLHILDELQHTRCMDTLSPESRHNNMSHIRSKDTKPEKQIRSALWRAGFRYRICDKRYPGKPDLVFPRYYAVIFINGCFWHAHGWESSRCSIISPHANGSNETYAHGWESSRSSIISSHANGSNETYAHGWGTEAECQYFRFPHSNQDFWRAKFMRNRERDAATISYYKDQCWRICVVWECAIRGKKIRQKIENVAGQISLWLEEPDEPFLEIRG